MYEELIDDFEDEGLDWEGVGVQQDKTVFWEGKCSMAFTKSPIYTCHAYKRFDRPRDWSCVVGGSDGAFLSLRAKIKKEPYPCNGHMLVMILVDITGREVYNQWWLDGNDYDWQELKQDVPWSFYGDGGFDWTAVKGVRLSAYSWMAASSLDGDSYDYPVVDYFVFKRFQPGERSL